MSNNGVQEIQDKLETNCQCLRSDVDEVILTFFSTSKGMQNKTDLTFIKQLPV